MVDIIPGLKSIVKEFYLGGGTALTLQIGHRKSIDPDPVWLDVDYSTQWKDIKQFFIQNSRLFKHCLI